MTEPKTVGEMLAELFREVGVLVLTFGFLDAVFQESIPRLKMFNLMVIGLVLFGFGVYFERRRTD